MMDLQSGQQQRYEDDGEGRNAAKPDQREPSPCSDTVSLSQSRLPLISTPAYQRWSLAHLRAVLLLLPTRVRGSVRGTSKSYLWNLRNLRHAVVKRKSNIDPIMRED
jgi:hypothetical protein